LWCGQPNKMSVQLSWHLHVRGQPTGRAVGTSNISFLASRCR
jgi:hypothetical protein